MARKTKSVIRTLDAAKSWPSKGQTKNDRGVGSRAKSILSDLSPDESVLKRFKGAYGKVVKAVESLGSDDEQRAVLLMAASDFEFDSLVTKSQSSFGYGPRLSETDERRIQDIRARKGDAFADAWMEELLLSKTNTKAPRNGS